MSDTLKTILITVITSSGIIGIGTKFLLARIKMLRTRQQALEKGIQALLRNALIQQYDFWSTKQHAPIHIKDNFNNMYQQYHSLGANGVMVNMYQAFMELPVAPSPDKEASA